MKMMLLFVSETAAAAMHSDTYTCATVRLLLVTATIALPPAFELVARTGETQGITALI